MTAITERVLNDALSLPPIERAELIQRLFRIEAYDKGLLTASPAENVLARINRR